MDRLIYTALSGMNASMTRERMIASNMANAQTIGFRAEILQQSPMTLEGPQLEVRAHSSAAIRGASMKEGALIQTGRALDVALAGDAMLAVQAGDGGEAYTRRGDLSVSITGLLENGDGRPVLGETGPITVPPGSEVAIAADGAILIADPATPDAPPQRLDRLRLVSVTGTRIEKDIEGLFRVPGGGALPVDEEAQITPGALEQSNVNPSQVLVEMIEAQRLFDLRTKLVSTAQELDQGSARLMRIDS